MPLNSSILPAAPTPAKVMGVTPKPPTTREFGDSAATRQLIYANALSAAQAIEPIEDDKHRLSLSDVDWHDDERFTRKQRKNAVLTGQTLARRMKGTWQLHDKTTGELLDSRRQFVGAVPYLTSMGTFVHRGSEYSVNHQQRLKPGVYAREKENGELESHFNVLPGKGVSHRYFLDPAKGVFKVKFGQAEMPLMPLLRAMGTTDKELRDHWGSELLQTNYKENDPSVIKKLSQKLLRKSELEAPGGLDAKLAARFSAMELDPEVTARTLGHPHDRVTKEAILAATKKLLAVGRGESQPDDRDHLAYQQFVGPEDLFAERIRKDHGGVRRGIFKKVTKDGHLQHMPSGALTPQIEHVLLGSGLAQALEEINPMEVFDKQSRVTRMGVGGIPSIESIPDESRSVQPSHMGFIDPSRTPESLRAGVDLNMARGARKGDDGRIYTQVRDKTGKTVWKSPQDMADASVATPDVVNWTSKRVPVMKAGKLEYVPKNEIDYVLPEFSAAFSPLANLIPFMSATKPGRVAMGARYMTQALPLVGAEAPLVQAGIPGHPEGKSFDDEYGKHMGAVRAEKGGRVMKVDDDVVHVKYDDGKTEEIELYNHHPFNRKTFVHQTPMLRPGDTFKPGQLLAKSNYTDDTGAAALGANMRVAYMAYKGSVTPDTHVLWYEDGQPRYTPIADVVAKNGLAALSVSPKDLSPTVLPVNGFVAHLSDRTVRVKTSSGRMLGATLDHSFVELDDDGKLRECKTSDLRVSVSWVPRLGRVTLPVTAHEITIQSERRKPITVTLDYDFGVIVGLYIAEGCRSGCGVAFAATDPIVRETIAECVSRVLPGTGVGLRQKNYVRVGSSPLLIWLMHHCGHLAHNKKIPDVAFGAGLDFRRGVLSGFWTGDGRVHDKKGTPTDTDTLGTSRRLRDGLGLLCASLGISTTHGDYDDPKCTFGKTYRLGVCTRDISLFPDLAHSTKGDRLKAIAASYADSGVADHVPLFSAVRAAYAALAKGCDKTTYNRIYSQAKRSSASRRDVLAAVPHNTGDKHLRQLRRLAESPLEWDLIEEIVPIPYTGMVYDFDMSPLRTFVCVDTLVVHNSNFEDAAVISEAAADRLKSEHMYQHEVEVGDRHKMGKAAYVTLFPAKYDRKVLDRLDEKGVMRVGETVEHGDPLILTAREKDRAQNKLHKKRQPGYADESVVWKHHDPGTVTDVVWGKNGPVVLVKSHSRMQVGDKLSGRYGDKSVVSAIVPNDQMPHDKDGQPFELLISPDSVITRTNPSQKIEAAVGKIAAKLGHPVKVPDFQNVDDLQAWAEDQLRRNGLSSTEDVIWPEKGVRVPGVGTGNRFIMKLHHTSESKEQGRASGAYSSDETPAKGGETGCFTGDTLIRVRDADPDGVLSFVENTMRDATIEFVVRERFAGEARTVAIPQKRILPVHSTACAITDWFHCVVPATDLVTVTLENGQQFSCTKNHELVKANRKRVLAGDLTEGDDLLEAP